MEKVRDRRFFRGWSKPIAGTPERLITPLRWLALLPRLYAGIVFIPYGFDKVLNGNQIFGMDATFFRQAGVPFPELAQIAIGVLELFGGVCLAGGFLTRVWAALLAIDMLFAMLLVGNTAIEAPLFVACLVLLPLGGGMLSGDQLLDY